MKPFPVPTTHAAIAELLHEAVVYGHLDDKLVIGRRRPFISCGTDPTQINFECSRRYTVDTNADDPRWQIVEVTGEDIVPFVDRAAMLAADDARANAAQRTNIKPIGELIARSSIGEAVADVRDRGIDAHLADPRTKP